MIRSEANNGEEERKLKKKKQKRKMFTNAKMLRQQNTRKNGMTC